MKKTALLQIPDRQQAARQALASCQLCPRHCAVNRLAGERGYCGLDATVRIFRELLHPAEEAPLNPSHQIYFAGCNLRCEFCSVWEWLDATDRAAPMDLDSLLACIDRRRQAGAVTLNLLGGEPALSIHGILALLAAVEPDTCVVWNSNMYYSAVVDGWLEGLVDVTLADLKCGNETCSERLLDAADYCSVVRRNIQRAARHSDVIVRCPVIPGHLDCCLYPNLAWIAQHVPQARVSLREDYVPPSQASHAPLHYTSTQEKRAAHRAAETLGLQTIQ